MVLPGYGEKAARLFQEGEVADSLAQAPPYHCAEEESGTQDPNRFTGCAYARLLNDTTVAFSGLIFSLGLLVHCAVSAGREFGCAFHWQGAHR